MCHSFFTHSSVNEHLGCFHVLVIVNSATKKHWDARILLDPVFLQIYAQE